LSFQIEPGFFMPQDGQTGAERLTRVRQLGQRSEVLFAVFIMISIRLFHRTPA
jgi:hypothetical protein